MWSKSALKFGIALTLAGQRWMLVGVDIPVAWFFAGLPSRATRTTEEAGGRRVLLAEAEAWADAVLTRGVYVGAEDGRRLMTPELVQRLGSQRPAVALRYLSAVGWLAPESEFFVDEAEEPPDVSLPAKLPAPPGALHRAFTSTPEKNIRQALRDVADEARVPVHVVWRQWMISEFCWTWRLMYADAAPAQEPAGDTPHAATDTPANNVIPLRRREAMPTDPDLLAMMHVGIERDPD
jgi:hypothetical protein